ncbi:MAG: hypothetical protein ACOYI4_08775 [Christensenellales bacterium]|jgi:hypothetical protein
MPFAQAVMVGLLLLLAFDVLDDVLDTLSFSKRGALLLCGAWALLGMVEVNIGNFSFNAGGFLVPLAAVMVMLYVCRPRVRNWSLFVVAFVATGCYVAAKLLPYYFGNYVSGVYLLAPICAVLSLALSKYRVSMAAGCLLGLQLGGLLSALEELIFTGYATVNAGMGDEGNAVLIALLLGVGLAYCTVKMRAIWWRRRRRQRQFGKGRV